jgi:hypothetical protein
MLDLLRQEYLKGKVVDKYSLGNGNIGLVIDDNSSHKRYHVEFKDGYKGPAVENLFGIIKEPFSAKTEQLGRLVNEGDSIELTVSYSKEPFRQAFRIYSVSRPPVYQNNQNLLSMPTRYPNTAHYC